MPDPNTYKEVEATLSFYLDPLIKSLEDRFIQLGLLASGNWLEQLEWTYGIETDKINILFFTADYTDYITPPGRRPGPVPYQPILDWVNQKAGLPPPDFTPEQFAWVVVRKLNEEGISVPNPYNKGTLTDPILDFIDNKINDMIDDVASVFSRQFERELLQQFQKSPLVKIT